MTIEFSQEEFETGYWGDVLDDMVNVHHVPVEVAQQSIKERQARIGEGDLLVFHKYPDEMAETLSRWPSIDSGLDNN